MISQGTQDVASGDLAKIQSPERVGVPMLSPSMTAKALSHFLGQMNAYHTKIEQILASDLAAQSDGGLGIPADERGTGLIGLRTLARTLRRKPQTLPVAPPSTRSRTASTTLQKAVHARDAAAARAALGAPKVPYFKPLTKFG